MPQMLAQRLVEIAAPADRVRDAVVEYLDVADHEFASGAADTVRVPFAAIADDAHQQIHLTSHDDMTTLEVEATSEIRVPYFHWLFGGLIVAQLERRVDHTAANIRAAVFDEPRPAPLRAPLLLANVPFSQAQATMLACAAFATTMATFGGSLLGQNAQNVQDSFGIADSSLTRVLAISRSGALVALFVMALADRVGRRKMILVGLGGVAISNVLSAFAPDVYTLTVLQSTTRGFVGAAAIVAGIAAIEEAPEGARAFAAAMLTMAGGFGFTMVVVLLPLADVGQESWRLGFAISGLTLFLLPGLARRIHETRRYSDLSGRDVARGRAGEVVDRRYGKRFILLAAVGFMTNMLAAPSAGLMNKYLEDDRGFSNSGILGFRAVTTGLPGFVGIVLAGRLSELRGRRPVAAVFLSLAGLCQIGFFLSEGTLLYVFSILSVLAASCGGLAISTMGAELFPTEVRGTSNGMLLIVSVMGSAAGLLIAGMLSESLGGVGKAIAWCAIPTIVAALALIPFLPEPAGKDLDEISPTEEDVT